MILFLFGEPFLVREKLQQITERAESNGIDATNRSHLDGSTVSAGDVRSAVQAMPFIAPQRLVVVRDWFMYRSADESGELVEALKDTPETTIAVVAESGSPDARRTAFKELKKLAEKSWEFQELDEQGAARWLLRVAGEKGMTLGRAEAALLVERIGVDLWALSTELDKLANAEKLDAATITQMTTDQKESDIFALVDALGRRDAGAALKEYHRLREVGEEPLRVFAMIVRQFRTLIASQSLAGGGATEKDIAKVLGHLTTKKGSPVHPFVAKKARQQAERYSESELREIYQRLADLDRAMKTGGIEPDAGMELFIIEATGAAAAV